MKQPLAQPRDGQAGSASAQLAVAAPALLLLLLVVVQFGVYFHAAHVARAAAAEAVRAARALDAADADGERRAAELLDGLGSQLILDRSVTVTAAAGAVRAEVRGYAAPVVPLLRLPVRAVAESPRERFTPP